MQMMYNKRRKRYHFMGVCKSTTGTVAELREPAVVLVHELTNKCNKTWHPFAQTRRGNRAGYP